MATTKQRAVYVIVCTTALILYLFLGAGLFTLVEKPHEQMNVPPRVKTLQNIVQNLHYLKMILNETADSVLNKTTSDLLDETEEFAHNALNSEMENILDWNIFTGFHFCMSIVTTIGYGYIAPTSLLGRGLCIPYALIGIPLYVYFSSNMGFLLACAISKLYFVFKRVFSLTCIFQYKMNQSRPPDGLKETQAPIKTHLGYSAYGVYWTDGGASLAVGRGSSLTPEPECAQDRSAIRMAIGKGPRDTQEHQRNSENWQNGNKFLVEKRRSSVPPTYGNVKDKNLDTQNGSHVTQADHHNMSGYWQEGKNFLAISYQSTAGNVKSKNDIILDTQKGSDDTQMFQERGTTEYSGCPTWFVMLFFVCFCSSIAYILYREENGNWPYIDCLYFVVVAFTTVGFGDLRPSLFSRELNNTSLGWFRTIYCFPAFVFGLVMLAAWITIWNGGVEESVCPIEKAIKTKNESKSCPK